MENLKKYEDFIKESLSEEALNEGVLSKTFLALSIALSSLFVNVNKAEAAAVVIATSHHDPEYPLNFEMMHDNYDDVLDVLRGLKNHVKDPLINQVFEQMVDLHRDLDHMGYNTFMIRWNAIKPNLVKIIQKYGTSNYNIEQIDKHITSKDFKRASVDLEYLKKETDKISEQYKLTGWGNASSDQIISMFLLGFLTLVVVGFIGYMVYNLTVGKIDNRRLRRQRRIEQRERALHPPQPVPRPPQPQLVHPPHIVHRPVPEFDVGSRITYSREGSEHNGKIGVILRRREDGKYSVLFDDGHRLAASPQRLIIHKNPKNKGHEKEDPFQEENWEN